MKIKNQNQKQNGISSSFGILIIVIIAVVAVGGVLAYQYMWSPDEPIKPIEEIIKPSMSEEEIAEKVVVDAFTYLHNREYSKAVPLFAWDQLEEYDPGRYLHYEGKNKEKALETACGFNNENCPEFNVVDSREMRKGQYDFKLQFYYEGSEGKIITGIPYGMEVPDLTEEEWEKYGFSYVVKKIEGEYKVMRGPFFTP